ncbi:MAG: hypothetical protein QXJ27_01200 [Thermoplasmata archaeon]
MAGIKFSSVVWAAVTGILLLIVFLLFALIWISYPQMWAYLISGILALVLALLSYFSQAFIEKPLPGQVSALVFGLLGIGFLVGAAWLQEESRKIPCIISVLIVAVILLGFAGWKLRDMEREKEIKAKRKKL